MNRPVRIAINTLAPPLIATVLLTVVLATVAAISSQRDEITRAAKFIPLVLFFSYVLAGVPSLLHAFLMEWIYHRHQAHTWTACAASGASGALAGVLIDVIFVVRAQSTVADGWLLIYPALGLIVGLLLGFAIKLLSESTARTNTHSLRGCE